MADVSINVGTDGSSLDSNHIQIGDIAGGNIETKRIADHVWIELQNVKSRIKAVEGFLSGALGAPGLTGQVERIKDDVKRIEREIELLDTLDGRLDKLESILQRYDPMWRAMEASYSSKVNVPVYVFYAVMALLVISIIVTFMIVWSGRFG